MCDRKVQYGHVNIRLQNSHKETGSYTAQPLTYMDNTEHQASHSAIADRVSHMQLADNDHYTNMVNCQMLDL